MLAIYKPQAGERPLWDFPDGSLAAREVAAYAVSELLGWQLVPRAVAYTVASIVAWSGVTFMAEAVTVWRRNRRRR